MKDEYINPGECDCCAYKTKSIKFYDGGPRFRGPGAEGGGLWLCAFCATTYASRGHEYPNQFPDAASMKTTCYVGNAVVDAIGELRDELAELHNMIAKHFGKESD